MNDAVRPSSQGEHEPTILEAAPSEGKDAAGDPTKGKSKKTYPEDTDNRGLFDPKSKYDPEYLDAQKREQWYIASLLGISLIALAVVGLGILDKGFLRIGVDANIVDAARKYEWICAGGLLGGTVYAASGSITQSRRDFGTKTARHGVISHLGSRSAPRLVSLH